MPPYVHDKFICRFVQAQPTWTHWSFPFVGRWLLAKMKGCKAGSAWHENQGCGITMKHKTVTWLLCCVKRTQSFLYACVILQRQSRINQMAGWMMPLITCAILCLYHHCSQGDLRMACQPTTLLRMKICWTWHCGSVAAPRTGSFNR